MKKKKRFNQKVKISMGRIMLLILCIQFLGACKKDVVSPNLPNKSNSESVLTGEITSDKTLNDANTYTIKGTVLVQAGATLTIPAGTKIIADQSDGLDVLIINQGGKIETIGSATRPIVFTSKSKEIGSWGGIVLIGKAPINVPGGTSSPEFSSNLTYGGSDPNDNSGILSYVRVEYAGAALIAGSVEYNGFGFYGVGSGTTINNLETYKGSDDGYEFFGGTVDDVNNLISIGDEDDSFDWAEGWTGGGSNWIAIKEGVGDRGIENDNNENDNTLQPMSNPTVSNITLKGMGIGYGMLERRGAAGEFNNVLIKNFETAIGIRDDQTITNVQNGDLSIEGKIENCTNTIKGQDSQQNNATSKVISVFSQNVNTTGADPNFAQGWSRFDSEGYSL